MSEERLLKKLTLGAAKGEHCARKPADSRYGSTTSWSDVAKI